MKSYFAYFILLIFFTEHSGLISQETYIKTTTYNQAHSQIDEFVPMGTKGIAHWANYSNVPWYIGTGGAHDVSESATITACDAAFSAWENVSTANVTFASCSGSSSRRWGYDGYNVLYWAESGDDEYESNGPLKDDYLAMTIITVNSSNELLDADIVFNGRDFTWTTSDNNVIIDIQSVAAHEIGHLIGMGHVDLTYSTATMYALYSSGTTHWRNLAFDDEVGVSFLYSGKLIRSNYTLPGGEYEWGLSTTSGSKIYLTHGGYNFKNNSCFIIKGQLFATGNSENPTGLNFHNGSSNGMIVNAGGSVSLNTIAVQNAHSGIKFESGSTGIVSNCKISNNTTGIYVVGSSPEINNNTKLEYNYTGIYVSNASPIIKNSTIDNNTHGIKISNSYSPSWTTHHIDNNDITNNAYYGLYLYNSSPTLASNDISSNERGIALFSNSDPYLGSNTIQSNDNYGLACFGSADPYLIYNDGYLWGGYNSIASNTGEGITITGSSDPVLGVVDPDGFNSIYSNGGYEIENLTSNTIYARKNYWGSAAGPDSSTDFYGTMDFRPFLENPPGPPPSRMQSPNENYFTLFKSSIDNKYKELLSAILKGDLNKSKTLFDDFLKSNRDHPRLLSLCNYYISLLSASRSASETISEIDNVMHSLNNSSLILELLYLKGTYFERTGDFLSALQIYENLVNDSTSEDLSNRAKINLAHIYFNDLNDIEKGKSCLAGLISKINKDSYLYELAEFELASVGLNTESLPHKKNHDDDYEADPLNKFALASSPNPFNPSTRITYSLPPKAHVVLKVYDMLGREVYQLVNEVKESGEYSELLDGNNLASGMYIVNIQAGEFNKSMKVLLLK